MSQILGLSPPYLDMQGYGSGITVTVHQECSHKPIFVECLWSIQKRKVLTLNVFVWGFIITLYLGFSFKVVDKCSVYHSSSVPTVQWWRGGLCIRISFDSVSGFLSTLYQDFLLGIKTLWFLPPKTRSLISNCHSSSSFLISCFCQALFIINCFCSSSS